MNDPGPPAHPSSVRELLPYFGTCPACSNFAEVYEISLISVDGSRTVEFLETCGLPCGWVGRRAEHMPPHRRDH